MNKYPNNYEDWKQQREYDLMVDFLDKYEKVASEFDMYCQDCYIEYQERQAESLQEIYDEEERINKQENELL